MRRSGPKPHLYMDAPSLLDTRQMRGRESQRDGTRSPVASILFPLTAIAFAAAIFIIDTFTPLGIAVAALYVVVVLMAGRFLERRGVLWWHPPASRSPSWPM